MLDPTMYTNMSHALWILPATGPQSLLMLLFTVPVARVSLCQSHDVRGALWFVAERRRTAEV